MKGIIILQLELKLGMQIHLREGTPAPEIHTWLGKADSLDRLGTLRHPFRPFPVLLAHSI